MFNININITAKDLESEESVERLLYLIRELETEQKNFDNEEVEFHSDHKIMKKEIEIRKMKRKYQETFEKNPDSIATIVGKSIFKRRVFTMDELRDEFPNTNWATIRSYVHNMKKDGILELLDRGKYVLL